MKILFNLATLMCVCCFSASACAGPTDPQNKVTDTTPSSESYVYKLFPTQNIWTFIKLNTRNGQMWQVQYAINSDNRGEYYLSSIPLVSENDEVNGRFTLYPTQNIYNFILLDQISGKMWQAQWSTDIDNRGIVPIEPVGQNDI